MFLLLGFCSLPGGYGRFFLLDLLIDWCGWDYRELFIWSFVKWIYLFPLLYFFNRSSRFATEVVVRFSTKGFGYSWAYQEGILHYILVIGWLVSLSFMFTVDNTWAFVAFGIHFTFRMTLLTLFSLLLDNFQKSICYAEVFLLKLMKNWSSSWELTLVIVWLTLVSLQPSANQFGSVDSVNAANGQIPSSERSVTPLPQDFMDPSMCYVPNGYSPFYFGGSKLISELFALKLVHSLSLTCYFLISMVFVFVYGLICLYYLSI